MSSIACVSASTLSAVSVTKSHLSVTGGSATSCSATFVMQTGKLHNSSGVKVFFAITSSFGFAVSVIRMIDWLDGDVHMSSCSTLSLIASVAASNRLTVPSASVSKLDISVSRGSGTSGSDAFVTQTGTLGNSSGTSDFATVSSFSSSAASVMRTTDLSDGDVRRSSRSIQVDISG
jgi:hypothetical protein